MTLCLPVLPSRIPKHEQHDENTTVMADDKRERPTSGRGIQKNILRVKHDADVYDRYEVTEVVGTGSMGHVAKVRVKANKLGGSAFVNNTKSKANPLARLFNCCLKGDETALSEPRFESTSAASHIYALKSIHVDRISPLFLDELKNEIAILRNCDHPNVVKAHEVYMTPSQIYLILECCEGDLYTRAPYSERDSARIISQTCSAINYLHDHNIVHRDLKVRMQNTILLCADPFSFVSLKTSCSKATLQMQA